PSIRPGACRVGIQGGDDHGVAVPAYDADERLPSVPRQDVAPGRLVFEEEIVVVREEGSEIRAGFAARIGDEAIEAVVQGENVIRQVGEGAAARAHFDELGRVGYALGSGD